MAKNDTMCLRLRIIVQGVANVKGDSEQSERKTGRLPLCHGIPQRNPVLPLQGSAPKAYIYRGSSEKSLSSVDFAAGETLARYVRYQAWISSF